MKRYLFVSVLVLAGILAWLLSEKSRELDSLEERCDIIQREIAKAETMRKQIYQDNMRMKSQLAAERSMSDLDAPRTEAPYEDALDIWLTKVKRLNAYLLAHPERRIPQMSKLTVEEWLDVTKDYNLDSEAEFRQALGRLRGIARQKFAPDIGAAIHKFVAANNGVPSHDTSSLSRYLPDGYDLSMVNGYAYNPSGKISGLVTEKSFVYVEEPIDIWDSTLFFAVDGK